MRVNGAPIYIHNVYEPTVDSDRARFFEAMETSMFEATATHFVLGDFNLALNPTLDASSNVDRPDLGGTNSPAKR
ncbi:TPA: hypothetical protein N0F65_002641 [Lagenidium giganteum]|uniref:Endonuclease/exonuclease/phosphatase domain-containing protein n=1 Tax=Lagenidium giganteum TaxID=4803 RepID=A0AAV2Z119_9STRA|nr:TPA: hypothetical protein N0F65_002641 [Lagenidium giganteum]